MFISPIHQFFTYFPFIPNKRKPRRQLIKAAPLFIAEPLEARRMLSAAGITIGYATPSSWNVYAGTGININYTCNWWQGTSGGGTTKTMVVGIHNSSGNWVSGTTPVALFQDNPPASPPGDSWSWSWGPIGTPATPGSYLVVAAEEPTGNNTTAVADFESGQDIAVAIIGPLTANPSSPGITIASATPSSWNAYAGTDISINYACNWWQGTSGGGTTKTMVVGIQDLSGNWVRDTTPVALFQDNPPAGPPGDNWSWSWSPIRTPSTPGSYLVVAAEEPTSNNTTAVADFESGQDIAVATIGPLTVTRSCLLPFPTWNQNGQIPYGTTVNYNDFCPIDPATGDRSINGCVPTGVAELVYYWRSLTSLSFNEADAYTSNSGTASAVQIDADSATDDFPNFATLGSDLANIQYNYNPTQMALLVFGLGIDLQASYSSAETDAGISTTQLQNWGFATAAWSSDWSSIEPTVIANIQAGEPVMVNFPRHVALIDGYDQMSGQFHVVLGWGGSDDGWYTLPDASVFSGTSITGEVTGIGYNLRPAVPLAANLAFTHVPGSTNVNSQFSISVSLNDITGAAATGDTSTVTLSISSGPTGGALGGSLTATAVNGVATFNNLTLSEPGNYTLAAVDASDGLGGFVSAKLAAYKYVMSAPPTSQSATVAQSQSFAMGSFAQFNGTAPFSVEANWGDGTPDSIFSMGSAGAIPAQSHTYSSAGNYTVSETVTDLGNNISNVATFGVTVTPATPAFSNLGSWSINYGTASVAFSGKIGAGNSIPPTSEVVAITLNGVTQNATINSQGEFSATFNTSQLAGSATPYQVTYSYVGDANFNSVTDNTTSKLTVRPLVSRVTPAFSNLSVSSSIAQGTVSVAFGGTIAAGALLPPNSETVAITLNGVTQNAAIVANGNFATTFNTSALPASNKPYQITYSYAGDSSFKSVTDNITTTLLVMPTTGTEESVWRLYSPVTKEHLYTADPNEVSTLVTRGWTQEGGVFFNVYTGLDTINGVTDVPMYRLYDIVNQQHLYTTDPNEYNTLKNFVGTWSVDGVFGYIFPSAAAGSTAIYRMNYPFAPDLHLLTTDHNEYTTLAAQYGWTEEGIIGYVM